MGRKSRKNLTNHKSFEAVEAQGSFTKIVDDMIDSSAWQSLTAAQRGLYLEFKRKYNGENQNNISMPRSEYNNIPPYSNGHTFERDSDALIEAGFIKIVIHGQSTKTANIYGFSRAWTKYGQPNFHIPPGNKRIKKRKSIDCK